MSTTTPINAHRSLALAVALYLVWVVATYLLEGLMFQHIAPDMEE
jgi:hypothetical protein